MPICVICGREYGEHGHNAWPVAFGQCCGRCDKERVLPARIKLSAEQEARVLSRALGRIFP
jgi:hypothetical protein